MELNKSTVKASSDISLVKYWGKKDEILRLPENGSISIKLEGLDTITTVEFIPELSADELSIEGEIIDSTSIELKRVIKHLDKIRALAKEQNISNSNQFAKVVSENSFPRSTGLSSSGSGMAALTFAATKAIGLDLNEKELSILSRQASGTACRCALGGFVEWLDGETSETSYSKTIFDQKYWDIRDIVAVVDFGKKKISSTEGHTLAGSSIFFEARQKNIKQKIEDTKKFIEKKDFSSLGSLIEAECLEFHSILLTSQPPMVLWYPGTLQIIHEVQKMRAEGIECYFTINTGFNVHVLTLPEFEEKVQNRLDSLDLVKKTLTAKVGGKPEYLEDHLF
ncbi:MAG: diphosphomevalonate decarboxylase [Candidatus Pacebacteria bacterium CG_4_10_14_3_um_filter_34_15]|nr:diphosphomevalonate decarboxylase [Candidatus Pacearchaeota archaeon]NCQ66043.1 diphosphomevalonate decarboxylase [Candidatus Paceibacterota bacterium]OIO43636.1 MAG: diphosphomevalonate decarboxylase [Candidatus Pacebacteria bacterium CG1_02_43_31]PIQ81227.1 MAG: diphosphomevalonate decarboxylase [Candidatus Pacebacteria bacterium CG11_big_fil_rev_8_21_14_0_20_34_55]PIX81459.1 MAG: diphosphomevalonate decarboxylase [Candidatus Pacebacteria bacterium CG_4_10_14_3_um_filter_34_15]PJC43644.1 